MSAEGLTAAIDKMRADGAHPAAVEVFSDFYRRLDRGDTGIIAESDIRPLTEPVSQRDLVADPEAAQRALDATAVIKLNGGLGTSMGMTGPKSLLPVRGESTFLDLIVAQVQAVRRAHAARVPLIFMDSFRTRDETLQVLGRYPDLAVDGIPADFLQNREPKLRADTLAPVEWPADPELEWCPPGHGDLYTALFASGVLATLLGAGYRYAFVSNCDNLGATPDPRIAGWFAGSGAPFASEVCRRTAADRKGGHLAVRRSDEQLVLRESAQTADEDAAAFADTDRHCYFNTNNLWLDLEVLQTTLAAGEGVLGLPLIRNEKNVDPSDPSSPKVVQIESAMGAAVEVFPGAAAIEVDRSRFLPVKTTNDLLVLRSDAYTVADDGGVRLAEGVAAAPYVDLDPRFYKLIADFDRHFPHGSPSLVKAASLRVEGEWFFDADVAVSGDATIGPEGAPDTIASGTVLSGHYGGR